jgi:hypothetical protein
MKPTKLCAALTLGCGVLTAGSATRPSAPAANEVTWRGDYEAARVEARQTGKPLFVAFR